MLEALSYVIGVAQSGAVWSAASGNNNITLGASSTSRKSHGGHVVSSLFPLVKLL